MNHEMYGFLALANLKDLALELDVAIVASNHRTLLMPIATLQQERLLQTRLAHCLARHLILLLS